MEDETAHEHWDLQLLRESTSSITHPTNATYTKFEPDADQQYINQVLGTSWGSSCPASPGRSSSRTIPQLLTTTLITDNPNNPHQSLEMWPRHSLQPSLAFSPIPAYRALCKRSVKIICFIIGIYYWLLYKSPSIPIHIHKVCINMQPLSGSTQSLFDDVSIAPIKIVGNDS